MAQYFVPEAVGELDGAMPRQPMAGNVVGAKVYSIRAVLDLAAQAVITIADNVVLGQLPADATFLYGITTASATLGAAAVIAIGTNPVHVSNGQFRAAALHTAVETPALFGVTVAQKAPPLVAAQLVYLTVGVASLPAAGVLVTELFYSRR